MTSKVAHIRTTEVDRAVLLRLSEKSDVTQQHIWRQALKLIDLMDKYSDSHDIVLRSRRKNAPDVVLELLL